MSIKGNIGQVTTDIAAVSIDSVVLDFDNRVAVSALSIHNTTTTDREVWFYASPNLTSASGKRVARHTLAGGASEDVGEIIGQGYDPNENVIAVVQTAGAVSGDLNHKLTYIEYTGGS